MRHSFAPPREQRGLSLVELMVAVTVALILLAGVLSIYISSKRSYNVQEGLARVQENARFALHTLAEDIRMAGYTGCDSKNVQLNNIVNPPTAVNFADNDDAITGFESPGSFAPGLSAADVRNGTDMIQIKFTQDAACQTRNFSPPNANLQVQNSCQVGQNEVVIVSDCKSADAFTVTNNPVGAAPGNRTLAHGVGTTNTSNKLSQAYKADGEVMRFRNNIYFIGTGASGGPALFVRALVAGAVATNQELVEGVEDMQILYGVDTDNDPDRTANRYRPASALNTADWPKVTSVRIALLFHTTGTAGNTVGIAGADPEAGNVATEPLRHLNLDYFLTGTNIDPGAGDFTTPADRRLRRVFTTTVKLRNRLFSPP